MTLNRKLIIFTHGNLAVELKNTAATVLGDKSKELITLSNNNLSLEEQITKLTSILEDDCEYIITTDFPGGSCFIASRFVSQKKSNIETLSGVNISMVISFLTKKEKVETLDDLVKIIETDGCRAIKRI